jgi:hypothetical protein
MNSFKLYMVYYMGEVPCWNLRVARSAEEALTQCFNTPGRKLPKDSLEKNCRAVEVEIKGYKITIEPVQESQSS